MSLISTYQSRKSLFAEKLITKGVEASATDGLTTLINKIDDIQSFTEGLLLYADKKIAQSEDTVNLYALLLEDNVAVSGKTVRFYSDIPFTTTSITEGSIALGDDYWVSTSSTGNCWIGIGGSKGYIQFTSTTIQIYISSWSQTYYYTGKFHIKDEVLTYTDMNGETQTIDLTGVGTSYSYGATKPFTVEYFWKDAVTNSEGIATIDYDCTGSGLREFYATYGSILSEIFVVIDGTFFDEGTSENTKWKGALQRSYGSNGTTLTATGNWQVLYCDDSTTTFNLPFAVEFDITALTDTPHIRFYGANNVNAPHTFNSNSLGHWRFEFLSDSIKTYKDGTEVQNWLSSLIGLNLSIAWQCSDTTDSITFKNFVVYPI